VDVLLTILLFVPFAFILWLANLALRKQIEGQAETARTLRWVSYVLLVALYLGFISLGLLLQTIGFLVRGTSAVDLPVGTVMGPERIPAFALSLWAPGLLGLVLLLRPMRRLFARLTPLDPDNPVQAIALSYIALVVLNLAVTLGIGLDNLAQMMQQNAAAGNKFNPVPSIWAQDIMLFLLGLIGVGWLSRTNLGAVLRRLGIVRPRLIQIGIGAGVGLLMVPIILLLEYLFSQIGIRPSSGAEHLSEQLIGPLASSVPGILTLGLAAALGEETIFRGALLPRFGLVLTTLVFALMHSQYGISISTLLVFGVGLVLGLMRMRFNTTTSMTAHAIYNMALGLLSMLGMMQNF